MTLLTDSYQAIADSSELVPAHKAEFAERLVTLYMQWGKPEQSHFWHQDLARLLSECLDQWKSHDQRFYLSYVMNRQNQLGESLCFLNRFEEAEALLLPAAALQEIHQWYDDPFSLQVAVDGNRQSLARLYDAWNKPDEANLWRALSPADANCGEVDLAAWYQLRIAVWESVCQRKSNSIYDVRLATAYSDMALLFLRYKKHDDALRWFEKSIELLERVRVDDPDDRWALASLTATQLSMADALEALNRHADALHCLELAVELAVKLQRDSEMLQSDLNACVQQASAKLALFLANCSQAEFRDPIRSLEIAEQVNNLDEHPRMRLVMGIAHYRLNDFSATIEVLGRGGRNISEKDFVLAMARFKMGDEETARFQYEAALGNYERYRVALKARNQLGRWWDFEQIEQVRVEATQLLGINQSEYDSLVANLRETNKKEK